MHNVKIVDIISWTLPMFGNNRCLPYYTLRISDGNTSKLVKTKEDGPNIYFIFNRRRYYIHNKGTMYSPNLYIGEKI